MVAGLRPLPRVRRPVRTVALLDQGALAASLRPRAGVILEVADPTDPGTFRQEEGPLRGYCRRVEVDPSPTPEGLYRATQAVTFDVGLPFVSWLFAWPLRAYVRAVEPGRTAFPWWSPPTRMPRRSAVTLATLCALSVLAGYLGGLLPNTMTYAAAQFGVGKTGQGVSLGVVQVGAVIALGLLVAADRRGRRLLIVVSAAGAVGLSALGAATPGIWTLTATQLAAGACVTSLSVALGVVAVEEMPARGRAWGIGVIGMCYGLGGGVTLVALPLADLGANGWRWLYLLSLLGAPWLLRCSRTLLESRRFEEGKGATARATTPIGARYRRRLLILGLGALLLALFSAPSSQFQNEYFRTQRHYSALYISLLEQIVGTIGGLGTVIGSRLAEVYGRRPVAATTIAIGTGAGVAVYLSGGIPLWAWSTLSDAAAYALGPVLGVYGGELFPTEWRGQAGGVLTILGSAGGLLGLVITGALSSAIGTLGPALAILAASQVALVLLILLAYPETAGRELEELYLEPALRPRDGPAATGEPGGS